MTSERDRLKISQETAIAEKAHLEQRSEDLQGIAAKLENDHLQNTSLQAFWPKGENSSLRLLKAKFDNLFANVERGISSKTNELEYAHEKSIDDVKRKNLSLRGKIDTFQDTFSRIKTEMGALQKIVNEKERFMSRIQLKMKNMQDITGLLNEVISNDEQKITNLRQQLDETDKKLMDTVRADNLISQEQAKLRDQLSTAKCQNQELNHKLESTLQESQSLQLKLQDSQTNVIRLEAKLEAKEEEKVHQAEEDNSYIKKELLNGESECHRLKERTQALEIKLNEATTKLDTTHTEAEELKILLNNKKSEMKKLETSLLSSSEKEMNSQKIIKKKTSKIQTLKVELFASENNVISQNQKADQLRSEVARLKRELDITKQQTATMCLEREHAVWKLQWQQLSLSYLTFSPVGRTSLSPSTSSFESS